MAVRICLLAVVLLTCACSGGGSSHSNGAPGSGANGGENSPARADEVYSYEMPADIGDGWTVGHLADHGFDVEPVNRFMEQVLDGRWFGIDGIAIARDGELLLNHTFRTELAQFDARIGNRSLDLHCMHSTSKSFVSALIGIAIDQGYLPGVSQPFYQLFGYASYDNWDPRKSKMTLDDVLTMRLGLEWDETTYKCTDPRNDVVQHTRDMTKFGQLYLDHGRWNGMQVTSQAWIDASVSEHVPLTGWSDVTGYGYQWWLGTLQVLTRTLPYYSTKGYGRQLIFVIPELALVVAFTGSNYENGHFYAAYDLMDRHVLPDAMGCEIPAGAFGPTSCP